MIVRLPETSPSKTQRQNVWERPSWCRQVLWSFCFTSCISYDFLSKINQTLNLVLCNRGTCNRPVLIKTYRVQHHAAVWDKLWALGKMKRWRVNETKQKVNEVFWDCDKVTFLDRNISTSSPTNTSQTAHHCWNLWTLQLPTPPIANLSGLQRHLESLVWNFPFQPFAVALDYSYWLPLGRTKRN